ncbi:MAG: class I SAM-dependent methyltransferase [Candidatus Binatia bacterium]
MSGKDDFGQSLPIGAHHYRAYVGPPEKYDLVGAMQFNLLTHLGLREFHYLLDIGCGSLRAGRLFIPYLLSGHYYGIEPQSWLVEEGLNKELGREILQLKRPVFSHDSDFNCLHFNQQFDFVVAQSIFSHAAPAQIHQCLGEVAQSLQPTGLLAATFVAGEVDYQGEGWVYPECVTYTLKQMKQFASAHNLVAETIDWPHPNGQTWLLIKRRANRI